MVNIETYYLIDYENVGTDGLTGCDKLKNTDHIHLFYTSHAKKIDISIIENHGQASLEAHEVPAGKQSADIHIGSFLGYLAGINQDKECAVIVVSKDTDFDNVIKFWNERARINALRIEKIKVPSQKSTEKTAEIKKKIVKSSKLSGRQKTVLNQEVMKAVRNAKYDAGVANTAAQIASSHYGEERILNSIHNDLRQRYTNYIDIYEIIRPVVNNAIGCSEKPKADKKNTQINREIQQLLSKSGFDTDIVNYVASVVVKNSTTTNGKQQIYRTIVSKYGQKKGLNIYNHVKKHI